MRALSAVGAESMGHGRVCKRMLKPAVAALMRESNENGRSRELRVNARQRLQVANEAEGAAEAERLKPQAGVDGRVRVRGQRPGLCTEPKRYTCWPPNATN